MPLANLTTRWLYPIFFLSGTAGLIYEVVWVRKLVLVFGSSTQSVVAVISAFLGGLALGSLLWGKWSDKKSPAQLIRWYVYLELGTALTASLSFPLIERSVKFYAYLSDGSNTSAGVLVAKFLMATIILLPPTTLMGGTLPLLIGVVQNRLGKLDRSLSFLYAINTFGGVVGVLAAGFFLLELVGLKGTLWIAVGINLIVGLTASGITCTPTTPPAPPTTPTTPPAHRTSDALIYLYTGLSGLISIAYEVLWTRALTPTTGTFIYAFALILAIYLTGIALGSVLYYNLLTRRLNPAATFAASQIGIGLCAIVSVVLMSNLFSFSPMFIILGVLLPGAICMGVSFPAASALLKNNEQVGKRTGWLYGSNTFGSIIGGLLASFILIPSIGTSSSILLLATGNLLLAIASLYAPKQKVRLRSVVVAASLAALSLWLFLGQRGSLYERGVQQKIDWLNNHEGTYSFKEDEVASVFGVRGTDGSTGLYIDGIQTTAKQLETKLMAHLPLALHPSPQRVLVIAFGMGTTFRSTLLHHLPTDVVELSRSVPKMFPLFYRDAQQVLANPQGRVIINDGRNYAALTKQKYDVVIIDPPPPFNAAGTTVLYAQEFYQQLNQHLQPGGLVSQWLYFDSRYDDIAMAVKSFTSTFPYAVAFQSPGSTEGIYLIGSAAPIKLDPAQLSQRFASPMVVNDLAEVGGRLTGNDILNLLIANQANLPLFTKDFPPITDDRPRTEYFLLRHLLTQQPLATGALLRSLVGPVNH